MADGEKRSALNNDKDLLFDGGLVILYDLDSNLKNIEVTNVRSGRSD